MNYLLVLLAFSFGVLMIYQIACGFPLISNISEKRRQKNWAERQKTKIENEAKIKLLDKKLRGENEVEKYITLNRFNLPADEKWKTLLPEMIRDLLSIGWTTDMILYSKFKYGYYQFHINTSEQDIINNAILIFDKYLDLYEEKEG